MKMAELRLLEGNIEDKLNITRQHKQANLVTMCCVCDAGIGLEDNKPVYFSQYQKAEIQERYNISHGYCKVCMDIEMYKMKE